ncbi:MAG: ATP-binding protein [Planctomycetota bacterium]|nr:ATP-binding protein [Planctomycetota bacterium]
MNQRRLGLRPALIALAVGAACAPALVLSLWLSWQASRSAIAHAEALLAEKAAMAALGASGRLAEPKQHLLWLATAPAVRRSVIGMALPGEVEAALAAFIQRYQPQLTRAALYDAEGRLIAGADRLERRWAPQADRAPWFVGAVSELAISGGIAPVHIARAEELPQCLLYACALLRPDNAVAGVVVLEAAVPALLDDVCGLGRTLQDLEGRCLAGQSLAGETLAASAPVRLAGQPAVHWRFTVAVPRREALSAVREVQAAVVAATLLTVLAAGLAAWLLARRLLRPLQRLERAVAALRQQGIAAPLPPVGGPPEIAAVAEALEDMRQQLHSYTERLEQTSERLRVVAEFAADWELWVAPDGRVLHCSPSCRQIAGLPAEDFLHDADLLWQLVDAQDLPQLRAHFSSVGSDWPLVGQWRLRRPDGSQRWVEHVMRRIRTARGGDAGWRITLRDVTERRAFEEQLRHEQRVQLLGRLAGGIAHDVNNLLAVISSHVEMLRRHPEQSDRLERILSAVERGSALTKQLLALSRRQVSNATPTDLQRAARETVDMLTRAWKNDVRVELRFGAEPLWARIDRAEFGQALMNLLVNARDAMPEGGTITVSGQLRHDEHGRPWCEVVVADQGIGMDAATLERIFEPYFTTKERGKGTGLGLPIVQALIEAAGGAISVVSELGQGSTFTIRLPACHPEPSTPSSAMLELPESLRECRVLVADDNRVQGEYIAELLEEAGALVRIARDGREAVAVAEHLERLDLLVFDIQMPGMNGVEAAQRVLQRHPRAAVVFITGYADLERQAWTLPAGAEVLVKPFDARRLFAAILAVQRR